MYTTRCKSHLGLGVGQENEDIVFTSITSVLEGKRKNIFFKRTVLH